MRSNTQLRCLSAALFLPEEAVSLETIKENEMNAGMKPLGAIALLIACTATHAETIKLKNGDTLRGNIIEQDDQRIVLQHEQLGRLEISRANVDSTSVEPPAAQAQAPEKERTTKIDFAANGSWGNTDKQTFRVGIASDRETEENRLKLDSAYTTGYSNGDRDENKFTAGGLHDWYFSNSPWLLFADGRYDYDDFQTWQHRLASHGGFGYRFRDTETLKLTGRIGAGAVKEWGSEEEDLRPEGLIGGDLRWKISDRQTLGAEATFYPQLDDMGEYRFVSKLDWSLLVDPATNMSLTTGLQYEYQSVVDPGFEHYDLDIFAGVRFEF
jgi:putative salt-induced outer membrane protein YdiY